MAKIINSICRCGQVATVHDRAGTAVCCFRCLFKALYYCHGFTDVVLAPDDDDDSKVHVLAHLVEAVPISFCRN